MHACIVWSQKFRKSEISLDTGAGPEVGFFNENRTRSRSRSEKFSFYRIRTIDFIKSKLSPNG